MAPTVPLTFSWDPLIGTLVPLPRQGHQLLVPPARAQALQEPVVPGEVLVLDPAAGGDGCPSQPSA
jgi:hypothetical protein